MVVLPWKQAHDLSRSNELCEEAVTEQAVAIVPVRRLERKGL